MVTEVGHQLIKSNDGNVVTLFKGPNGHPRVQVTYEGGFYRQFNISDYQDYVSGLWEAFKTIESQILHPEKRGP